MRDLDAIARTLHTRAALIAAKQRLLAPGDELGITVRDDGTWHGTTVLGAEASTAAHDAVLAREGVRGVTVWYAAAPEADWKSVKRETEEWAIAQALEPACRVCGCTSSAGCIAGCAETHDPRLCSLCVGAREAVSA